MSEVTLDISAINRVKEIISKDKNKDKFLRISISGGGCSGFQYIFDLDNKKEDEDIIIYQEKDKILAITDESSQEFLKDAKIEFVKELGASYFKVQNPNAAENCGCGSSFSV